jgi:phage-related minor tail protein
VTEPDTTLTIAVEADTSALQHELQQTTRIGRQFASVLSTAFDGLALKGRGLTDVVRGIGLSLSKVALDAAFKPLGQAFGNAFTGALASAGASGVAFAKGGTLGAGTPVPFADGGIIASPVTFPLGRGTGVAGERGPEAILPLSRGPDGRLGVAATGTGGGVHVTLHVTTPDAESFRRSETQLAAMLSRAIGHGQRNL